MSLRAWDTLLLAALLLLAWQCLYWRAGDTALASPSVTAIRLIVLLTTAEFWSSIAQTLRALVMAMAISTLGGVLLGLALALNRTAGAVMEPVLMAFYALPKVTLYPLVLLLFGLGISARVAFGAMHALVPVAMITTGAILQLPPILVRAGRAMHLTRRQIAWTILVPAIVPELAFALRIGFSLSLLGVVIGEMFASRRGLGFEIMSAMNIDDTATLMATATLLTAVALCANAALMAMEKKARTLSWSRS